MNTKNIPTADALARKFAELLREDIGDAAFAEVIRRNADSAHYAGCCASHDFCDANMTMLCAFNEFGITDDDLFSSDDTPLTALWNEAWDLAKTNSFYTLEMPAMEAREAALMSND